MKNPEKIIKNAKKDSFSMTVNKSMIRGSSLLSEISKVA